MEKLFPCHIFCHISFLHTKIRGKGYYDKMYLLNCLLLMIYFEKRFGFNRVYPNNALYSYKMYEWLQEDGKTVEALAFLEKAIRLMPRILLMESVQQKVLCDSVSCRQLTASLLEHTYLTDQDPETWARYGFMAYYCGKKDMAKSTLSHAVKEMPNLSTPWLLLGQIYLQEGKKMKPNFVSKSTIY